MGPIVPQQVLDSSKVRPGDWVVFTIDGGVEQLLDLNGGYTTAYEQCTDGLCVYPWMARKLYRFPTRIKDIPRRNTLLLERPLPYNFSLSWDRAMYIYKHNPALQNVGAEGFTMEFKLTRYPGHLKEQGYHGVFFEGLSNCWARNLKFLNYDVALLTNRTHFCTITDTVYATTGE